HEQHVTRLERLTAALDLRWIKGLTEPYNMRPDECSTGLTGRKDWNRNATILSHQSTISAADHQNIAVNLREPVRAGCAVEAVDILGDQPHPIASAPFEFRKREVCRIWRFGRDEFAPPIVPFPHDPRIPLKRFRRCENLRAISSPQAIHT